MLRDDKPRVSGISYLLANGKSSEITDPAALLRFYTRIFYGKNIKKQTPPRPSRKAV